METGTGKTYVYLRTIFELSRRYGFKKFIIVVPSVAIREGVLKNIEITREHFRALYNNLPFEHFVYDARKVNRLRQFASATRCRSWSSTSTPSAKTSPAPRQSRRATSSTRKATSSRAASPLSSCRRRAHCHHRRAPERRLHRQGAGSHQGAESLCTLRYSATHRNPYNLVYRLDPIRAFELKLVKQIVVASAMAEGGGKRRLCAVEQIDYTKGIKAKLRIHVQAAQGPKGEIGDR